MTSTPRQLLLYDGLGWSPPQFAHVPLLVEPGGKKLSKRHEAVSVQSYRDRGFTSEAVLNYLARLGWGHGDLEIVSREELPRLFDLSGVGKSPSQVHEDKLLWLNQHYLKELPREPLVAAVQPFLDARAGRPVEVDAGLARLLDLLRERSHTLAEMADRAAFYLCDLPDLDPKAARKHLKPAALGRLRDLREALAALDELSEESLRAAFESVLERHGGSLGTLAQPVRVAVTGSSASPGIFETLELLGRDRSLARLDAALAHIESLGGEPDPPSGADA